MADVTYLDTVPKAYKKGRRIASASVMRLMDFLDRDEPCMMTEHDEKEASIKDYSTTRQYIFRHHLPLDIHKQGNNVIIVKRDGAK